LNTPAIDFDSPWKEALEEYREDFFALFFPQAHAEIDWTRPYAFLHKELQQVVRDADLGRQIVDKLVRVWLLTGADVWVLAHIEVQSQQETLFWREIQEYEEERTMPYVTSVERIGLARGREEGLREALRRIVRARFPMASEALDRRIAEADRAALDRMLDRVSIVQTADDL